MRDIFGRKSEINSTDDSSVVPLRRSTDTTAYKGRRLRVYCEGLLTYVIIGALMLFSVWQVAVIAADGITSVASAMVAGGF